MISIIQKMADRAFDDLYLKKLLYKLEENYSKKLYNSLDKITLTEKEIDHLLRFSDILCRSIKSEHRNRSLKIISLLLEIKEVIDDKEYFTIIATNTLVKLGNFPSLSILNDYKEYLKIYEIRNDYILKTEYQNSPLDKTFTDSQYKVFEEIKQKNHYSFSGSTSFGKSFIFEAFTKYIIEENNQKDNIAFIVPTKALINQVGNRLKEIISNFNYQVITTPIIPKIFLTKDYKYIFVFTPERLISYFIEGEENNPKINYLFVDEAHKLLSRKDTRTPLLYHSLVLAKMNSVNIYFASPNITNADIFLEMINNSTEESIYIEESPVTQNRFFIDTILDKSYMISDFGENIFFPKLNFVDDKVANLERILNTFSSNSQSIIYCNTIYKTINTAVKFAECINDVHSKEIDEVIELIDKKVHKRYFLKQCLQKGVAYHFGGIPEEIKFRLEKLYREGFIKFLFCTSTLLEGVNLPAKNIFILSEKIGNSNMSDIDFWNLAGRAGRLSKDISGNIFCVNLYNQKGYWKDEKKLSILRKDKIKKIKPQIMSKQNENLYKNISNYFEEKDYTKKNLSADKKKMIEMYGNILLFHDLKNSNSVLKNKFIEINSIDTLKNIKNSLKVPSEILAKNIAINIALQNKIAITNVPQLPNSTSIEDCLKVLKILYEQYEWSETESGGRNPMIKSKEQLKYYAVLMEAWINTKPLKVIIQKAINYYDNNGNPRILPIIYDNGKKVPMKFNSNDDDLVNTLINNIVYDIESILSFKIKNYVSNYQALLKSKANIATTDWESYIEYGTTDNIIIEIQNLGLPRNIAIFLKENYIDCFIKNDDGIISDINSDYLVQNIDREKHKFEFEELALFMNLEI